MIPYTPPKPLSTQQVREIDRTVLEQFAIPGLILMENAARNAAEIIYRELQPPAKTRVVILCGPGNNGGDGFVVARHLDNAGVPTTVVLADVAAKSIGDAGVNLAIWQRMGGPLIEAAADSAIAQTHIQSADVIVDALLGTGARGAPRGTAAELVRYANAPPRAQRIAIDIPSGLDADTGTVHEPCFRAHLTITFVAAKTGFANANAAAVLGHVIVADIGAPRALIDRIESAR